MYCCFTILLYVYFHIFIFHTEGCVFLTFKMSTGDSRTLATSKATLPCPRMTAVSQLKSGLSWIEKNNNNKKQSDNNRETEIWWQTNTTGNRNTRLTNMTTLHMLWDFGTTTSTRFTGNIPFIYSCECEVYLSTAGQTVVPAYKVFSRVDTRQLFSWYLHPPVPLCPVTLP